MSDRIPNLKELLGRGRGAGRRDRARGGQASSGHGPSSEEKRDHAVRGTDQDAAGSRVSCVELGYLDDPYAKLFATQLSTRRLPLLNRGTYVRTSAIDQLIDRFLTTPTEPFRFKQIISLGAGTDTRFFRLQDKYPNEHIVYHEIDFSTNTSAKLASVRQHTTLQDALGQSHYTVSPHVDSYQNGSGTYNIHALDLRSLASTPSDSPLPELKNLNPTAPTLILSEMCLCYLEPKTVSDLMNVFLTCYLKPATPAALVLYEPILPNDAFGRTMISNLATRNIQLPTLTAYPELGDQRARLKQYGLVDGQKATDTDFIWRNWVSDAEKDRVAGLEMLDELEELQLLLRHYCVAWGWRDADADADAHDVFTKAWRDVREQS